MGVFYPLFICSGFYIVWDNILHWLITWHKSILAFRITVNLYCCCCIIAVINDHRVSKINQNLHIFACGTSLNVCLHSVSVAEVCFSYFFYYNLCMKTTALFSLTVHFVLLNFRHLYGGHNIFIVVQFIIGGFSWYCSYCIY